MKVWRLKIKTPDRIYYIERSLRSEISGALFDIKHSGQHSLVEGGVEYITPYHSIISFQISQIEYPNAK